MHFWHGCEHLRPRPEHRSLWIWVCSGTNSLYCRPWFWNADDCRLVSQPVIRIAFSASPAFYRKEAMLTRRLFQSLTKRTGSLLMSSAGSRQLTEGEQKLFDLLKTRFPAAAAVQVTDISG